MPEQIGSSSSLTWTGERMVPFEADPVTEFFHWQRYLHFRDWYIGRRVIDAASGEGYGCGYIGQFASQCLGYDQSAEAVAHASSHYANPQFEQKDVCSADYSSAELVVSFETIEHLADPEAFLDRLSGCPGQIVISTPNRRHHSPGHSLSDRPLNPFHTVEWTPQEFATLVTAHFPGRPIRLLSQENRFPGLIREGLDDDAKYTIAVVGDGPLPRWPKVGIAMPTCNGGKRVEEAIYSLARFYPGELSVALVANGSSAESMRQYRSLERTWPHLIHVIESPTNLGYGCGANLGLKLLVEDPQCDLFGVSNDDVVSSVRCLSELVAGFGALSNAGERPGMIGPVSNSVNGAQMVEIGPFENYRQMMERAEAWECANFGRLDKALQVRGLFFLTSRECLDAIGGFDPVYGLGNFEDDDWNLRARLAGFTLWIARGAFLYHAGSTTFKELGIDYSCNIQRNLAVMLRKWKQESHSDVMQLTGAPEGVQLQVPLDALPPRSGFSLRVGQELVDLVYQATDAEFAAAVLLAMQGQPRERRAQVLNCLEHVGPSSRCAA